LFSAGVRYLLERLFRRAHLKEVLLFLVAALGLLPQLLIFMNIRRGTLLHLVPAQLFWPWAAAAHIMLGEGTAPAGVWALMYLGFAWGFGRWQFERSIRYDAAGGRREREAGRSGVADGAFRLPGRFLRDPLAAIVEKELRTLARIPRFRMVYAMSGVFGLVIYLPALRDPQPQSLMMQSALPVMALYGLLMLGPITWWNAFGFDRSAVQGYFSWPVRFRDAIVAKNITAALLVIPQILVVITLGRIAHLPASPGKCLETAAVVLTASLYWFSLGNICSVRIPRALDPDRMNQMANKIQALSIFSAPFLLLPIGLAYWARAVFESEIVFSGVLLIAAMVGGVFYKVGLDSAMSAGTHRREQILMQLSRADGPLSLT
ncbi:MAG TPA: hypothetical protein VHC72_02500, partial [Bryobacteraceae bacterium]|nr:hypothetical protein [Bryobacteraceae bacterium]